MAAVSYPRHFYDAMHQGDGDAPARIVDCILSYVQPTSVVDVGCGVADFLGCFIRRGITDVQGVDLAIDPGQLHIPPERFTPHDLTTPYRASRQFDLVLSLEVAEHLPESAADTFVDTLVGLGSIVVFSAAVPEQDGFRHINLQWQDYWAEKFSARGYAAVDCLRDAMWNDEAIPAFYRQNMLMYVRRDVLAAYPMLEQHHARTSVRALARIHPSFYLHKVDPSRASLKFMLRALPSAPKAIAAAIGRRLGRGKKAPAPSQPNDSAVGASR